MSQIRCISLWQPWASLVAIGAKTIETRHWATSYRGPLAIHAALSTKGFDGHGSDAGAIAEVLREAGYNHVKDSPRGAILCVVDLTDCLTTEEIVRSARANSYEQHFGNYEPNRFGWILENARRCKPAPFKGKQGFFSVPAEILQF